MQTKLGALLYRAGRYDEALDILGELEHDSEADARSPSSPAYAWYFLAMTHQALGQAEQARDVLTRAEAWTRRALSDEKDRPVWNRRLTSPAAATGRQRRDRTDRGTVRRRYASESQ